MNRVPDEKRREFLEAVKEHPGWGVQQIAELLGWSWSSTKRYFVWFAQPALEIARKAEASRMAEAAEAIKRARKIRSSKAEVSPSNIPSVGVKQEGDTIELVSVNPCTLEDLLSACQTDLKRWRVTRHTLNKWEVGAKQEDGTMLRTPLYQLKAWLEPVPGLVEADAFREALEEIRGQPFRFAGSREAQLPVGDPHLLEVSLADLHFDRLTWGEECGENWDTAISRQVAMQAVQRLLALSGAFAVTKILYVAGNDFFTSDTPHDTTTAGTPQTVDGRWQKTFRRGIQLQLSVIESLRARAPVDILIVPGNHDSCRSFYLGCVLEAVYQNSKDVRVINTPSIRKYYRWGTVLLGFAHGHSEKHSALPLIMAAEASDDWSESTHREFHVGHFHHKRETQFSAGTESGPVRVRILPSLTGTDAWHAQQGYVGAKKASEAFVWSQKHGYVGHLNYSADPRSEISVSKG